MSLVQYGSSDDESDDKSSPKPQPQLAPIAPKKRKEQGPKKIMLDLPGKADEQADNEPPKKKPRFMPSATNSKSGLASMLPAPKKSSTPKTASTSDPKLPPSAPVASDDVIQPDISQEPMFVPHKVTKNKPSAKPAGPPSLGFFSIDAGPLHPTTTTSATSSTSSTSSKLDSSITFSSAPVVAEQPKQNYYATLPQATPDNPYPGFHCLPSGQWEPDKPEEWAEWAALYGFSATAQSYDASTTDSNVPKGFEDAQYSHIQDAAPDLTKPDKVPSKMPLVPQEDEDDETKEKKRKQLAQFKGKGRGRNQLSSLLTEAYSKREELEERIAMAKANKRAGGAKYGKSSAR